MSCKEFKNPYKPKPLPVSYMDWAVMLAEGMTQKVVWVETCSWPYCGCWKPCGDV